MGTQSIHTKFRKNLISYGSWNNLTVGILSGGSGGVEKYSTIDEQAGANHLRITSGEAASNE